MTRKTIFVCDICKTEIQAFEPPGWSILRYDRRSMRGSQQEEAKADVCSPACTVAWLDKQLNIAKEELNE